MSRKDETDVAVLGALTGRSRAPLGTWRSSGILIGPALCLLLAVYLYPVFKLLVLSLGGVRVDLTAYRALVDNPLYLSVFVRTLRISVTVTVICLVGGYPVGYLLSRVAPRMMQVLLIAILLPFWTSILVRTYAWMVLLQANGVLNRALLDLGLIGRPLKLMYNETGVVIGMVQVLLPFAILPIYSALHNIDRRLHAAAQIMGAGPWQRFRHVTLPLSLPGVAAASVLVLVQSLGYFITPALLGGSQVITLSMLIEAQVVDLLQWQLASAVAMTLLLVTVAIVAGFERTLGLEKVWTR